jgi:hypothetical protein
VALGPSLTQPCTTYRFERIEVRTSPQGRVYAVATEEEEKEEEVFDQILEERNAQFQSEKEKEIEEEQEWQEEKDFERAWKEEESDKEEEKYEEKEEKKEESKDPKKELKKKEGKGEDSGESSARERMRKLRQRRRSSILLTPILYLLSISYLSPIYLISYLLGAGHEPLRLRGGSGRGAGGLGGGRRRRPTLAQLRVNSRLLNPEFLSDSDLYEFARLTPEQFQVPLF